MRFLASRLGVLMWRLTSKKYMKFLKYFTRKLKKEGIVKDGILTLKDFKTESIPNKLSEAMAKL